MQKVMIGVHKSEKKELLDALQDKGILHIKNIKESKLKEEYQEFLPQEEITDKELEDRTTSLTRTIDYLRKFGAQMGFFDAFLPQKLEVSELEYEKTTQSYELIELSNHINNLEIQLTESERTLGALISQKESLLPWEKLDIELEMIGAHKRAISVAGILVNPPDDWEKRAEKLPIDVEIVYKKQRKVWLLFSYLPEDEREVKKFFTDIGFEVISFSGFKGKPKDIIQNIEKRIAEVNKRREDIIKESKMLAKKLDKFFILYDYYANLLSQKRVENYTLSTLTTICIEGWIRANNYKELERFINQFNTASLTKIKAEPGEKPPVELKNPKGWHIFETITELYSSPHSNELDPSPFLAPFFVIFFALCLTDACYGLMFVVIGLLLMKRIKGDRRLLWILIVGGVMTIPIGAITGGWFGDFPDRFNIAPLIAFKNKILVFDPMKQPLTFFMVALGFGFIHVLFGYFLGFVKAVREGKVIEGIAGKLAWVTFWIALLMFGLSFKVAGLVVLKLPLIIIIILSAMLVLFGSGGPSRNLFFKIAKGMFNLYQGLMGTVGDIISYSRLMALGLVTLGLATSINILVGVMAGIPYLSWILVPLLFIGGHVFSMGINVLGAYVHTLRLQYAEFFTKFFEGGGTPFKPFRKEAKYIIVSKK